jgi:hypothetical protein
MAPACACQAQRGRCQVQTAAAAGRQQHARSIALPLHLHCRSRQRDCARQEACWSRAGKVNRSSSRRGVACASGDIVPLGHDLLKFLIAFVFITPTFKKLNVSPILGFLAAGLLFRLTKCASAKVGAPSPWHQPARVYTINACSCGVSNAHCRGSLYGACHAQSESVNIQNCKCDRKHAAHSMIQRISQLYRSWEYCFFCSKWVSNSRRTAYAL